MSFLPKNLQRLIEELSKLPGIGPKTAERLAFYLLRKPEADLTNLAEAVVSLKNNLVYCSTCANLSESDPCGICQNTGRDPETICVVEELMDLAAIEKTHEYRGTYHVLHGVISPMDGVGPDDIKIAELIARVKQKTPKELIFALNPSIEGEATTTYIVRYLAPLSLKMTRLARGIPVGGDLEYADSQTLRRALQGRMAY